MRILEVAAAELQYLKSGRVWDVPNFDNTHLLESPADTLRLSSLQRTD